MKESGSDVIAAIRDLIYRSALMMDSHKVQEWLDAHCAPEFEYLITTYSYEIRREQEWFQGRREDLIEIEKMLPRHNSDHSPLTRHVTVYTVDVSEDGKTADAVSSVVIYRNMLDGINSHLDSGETQLFCVGKYLDQVSLDGGRPLLIRRNVRLDTRRMDKGSHFLL